MDGDKGTTVDADGKGSYRKAGGQKDGRGIGRAPGRSAAFTARNSDSHLVAV